MNVFDIIGPVMIGPSSSHTAGAVRLGRVAWKILGEDVVQADIQLAGSFAQTYRGHGTDKALIAGIMGMHSDDERIRRSLERPGNGASPSSSGRRISPAPTPTPHGSHWWENTGPGLWSRGPRWGEETS